ncbi:MAG: hypothetical protein KJ905_02880 [Nanoarchaeota archaeon]|nr:hypothetical protein [Nanoarchaeota archaeon]MBU1501694.1 hypothetical protein [Nanoarchaeota archaeon]MBU2459049.1 hypothetical protein [Nanoarchaeota archaeon]
MNDRKRMSKLRQKRIKSVKKQIETHKDKIESEEGRLDTTKNYWEKEINEKFLKQLEKDKKFIKKNGNSD